MIEVRGLTAEYEKGAGNTVLEGVNAVFEDRKLTIIIGPNGSGKSTLLRAVMGFLPIQSGEVLHNGESLSNLSEREIAQRTAFLPQSRPVPQIRVREMVLHGRFPYLSFPRQYSSQDRQIVEKALKDADAEELKRCGMEELSGGQRQKVYIAMALAQQTQNILLDEPTTYLDIRHQYDTMMLCRRIAEEGRCVAMILHDLSMAFAYADQIMVVEKGKIKMQGAPREVFASGIVPEVFGVELLQIPLPDGKIMFCVSPPHE